ncbi:hypothetical protein V8B97DRAFT_1918582 [Scleroderma yunnanense]
MSEEVQMCLWDDSDAGLTDLELDNMDALCLLQLTLVNANKEAEFLLDLRKEDGMDDGAEGSTNLKLWEKVHLLLGLLWYYLLYSLVIMEYIFTIIFLMNLDAAIALVHLPPGWKTWAPLGWDEICPFLIQTILPNSIDVAPGESRCMLEITNYIEIITEL